MSENCEPQDLQNVFPDPNPQQKYRFFNQPIDQIPNYKEAEPQILVHRPNCGLQWFTLEKCLDVLTCVKLETESDESELKLERKKIIVIKDFDAEEEPGDCPNISLSSVDVVTCVKLESEELVIERKKITVFKEEESTSEDCPNIPVTECPNEGGDPPNGDPPNGDPPSGDPPNDGSGGSGLSINSATKNYEFDEKSQTWIK